MIYFFTGDNNFMLRTKTKELINDFTTKYGDLGVERIDAEDAMPATIIDAVQSLPFLTSNKLVVVSNVTDKELLENLASIKPINEVEAIILIPKVDKRASYYKKISKLKGYKNFEASATNNLPSWVVTYAKEQGASISNSDARYLVERVGVNQLLLCNEIDKLATYNKTISKETIDELTEPTPQSTIFQLVDAAFTARAREVERLYNDQRSQKVEPHAMIGMLAWQLHILALVKAAGTKSADEIAREAKLNPFVVRKSQGLAHKLSMNTIKAIISEVKRLDIALKTSSIDADNALLMLLLSIGKY